MPITSLPTPPSRADSSTFATRADAFLGALPTFATEANTLQTEVNAKEATAVAAAATATTQAGLATSNGAAQVALATAQVALATTQANTATTQAGIATTAANNAILAQKINLGAKASDPSTDNEGGVLLLGASYYNTILGETRLWNGSTWQVAFGNITGDFTIVREPKTATAGQTVFNLTNSYVVGTNSIMVYLNGVRLMPSDYTETSTTSITLTSPAALNDELLFEIGVVSSGTTAVAGLTSFNPTGGISSTNVQAAIAELDSEKQPMLVSGTNIKTVNGSSLLGSGNLLLGGIPDLIRSARTSNTILGYSDKGTLIDITSGTFTQTFDAAATLGSGWWCYIRNAGTGDITLDPNASETIDDLASFVMYPGEVRLIQCDGNTLRSVVLNAFYKAFTNSGTFIKPPGYSAFEGMLWGGGAGAKWASWFDGADTRYRQWGGGGGGCMPFKKITTDLLSSETITVGSGGIRTTTHNATSNAGGNSIFAGVTAFGGDSSGNGGGTVTGSSAGIIDGLLTTNSSYQNIAFNFVGTPVRSSQGSNPTMASYSFYGGGGSMGALDNLSANTANGAGAFSTYGGGGGASLNGVRGGSMYGGRGADASNAAEVPGGGGHGSSVATYGDGARGEVRIWGVI